MSNVEIKSCPFCGSEAKVKKDIRWPDYSNDGVDAYEVICENMDCIIYRADDRWYKTEAEAIEAWNTRV